MWKLVLLLVAILCVVGNARRPSEADVALAESIRMEKNPDRRSGYSGTKSADDTVEEGDMDLTAAQYTALFAPSNRTKRQLGERSWGAVPWPNGHVSYLINAAHFSDDERRDLMTAMATIQRWSCVRFFEKNVADQNYININNGDGQRCSSSVGMVGRGEQQLKLAARGCRLISTYIHELLHALGFVHEHQLPSRTGFLKQWLVNAQANKHHNFQPYSQAGMVNYRQEYDLGSIMHYTAKSFNIEDGKTMTTGQPFQDEYIGMKFFNELSFGDVKSVNMFYKCAANCPKDVRCEARKGIQLKDCTCLTPDEYDSQTCRDVKSTDWCETQLLAGECYMNRENSGKQCAKTCGFCNVFKFDKPARVEDRQCDDYYFNSDKCAEFKGKGYCEADKRFPSYSKWMALNCRKTCGKCSEGVVCPNVIRNEYICYWYQESYCTDFQAANGDKMRSSCQTRCGLCGKRKEGDCENLRSDAECERRAANDECEEDSIRMFQDCPKTCNRCDYNQGRCENHHVDEQECLQLASINYCDSSSHKDFMEKKCSKACNTCHKASAACEDLDTSGQCRWFAKFGHCTNQLRAPFMRQKCAKSCGFC